VRRSTVRGALVLSLVAIGISVHGAGPVTVSEAAASVTPIPCAVGKVVGRWQVLPTPEAFRAYTVDPLSPWRIVGTTDRSIYLSDTAGCTWRRVLRAEEAFPLSSGSTRFNALATLAGRGILGVATDGGRTRVVGSDSGDPGSWTLRENGIPPIGAVQALAASSTSKAAFLALQSPAEVGAVVPGVQPGDAPLLFGSSDDGRSWSQRRASGLRGDVQQLLVDEVRPETLYARLASGQVVASADGGTSFQSTPIGEAQAMAVLPAGGLVAFGPGRMYVSTDSGRTFSLRPGPAEVASAAARADEPQVAVELPGGRIGLLSLGAAGSADAGLPGGLSAPLRLTGGRVAGASTIQAVSGTSLLRYVDRPEVAALPPGTRAPTPGSIRPGSARVEVASGGSRTVSYELDLPRNPSPLDVFFLIDITAPHEDLRRDLGAVGRAMAADGVDIAVGLGTIGSRPRDPAAQDPPLDPTYRDPSGGNRRYQRPRLYQLARRVGPPDRNFDAATAAAIVPETYSRLVDGTLLSNGGCADPECDILRPRGLWISLDQLMTGAGLHDHACDSTGRCRAEPTFNVLPGQSAGWRQDPHVRRVVVMGTPGEFDYQAPPGSPPGEAVTKQLVDQRTRVVGMSFNSSAWGDLERIVVATGGFAGKRLVDCGPNHRPVSPGAPLVCGSSASDAPERILAMLRAFPDQATVGFDAGAAPGLVRRIDSPEAAAVDVSIEQRIPFTVTYSCADRPDGTHPATISARLRGAVVATAQAEVLCGRGTPVAAPPSPPRAPAPASPPAPVNPQIPPPAPATPPAAAQVFQPQLGVHEVIQSEQQLQLAIAAAEVNSFEHGPAQLAMSRRSEDERLAQQSLLVSAIGASAGLVVLERRRRERLLTARGDLRAMARGECASRQRASVTRVVPRICRHQDWEARR
jgi:hypothetical protein